MLDITNADAKSWLREQLRELLESVAEADGGRRRGAAKERVVFYADSGNAFHMPTYFQVRKRPMVLL